jgi:hypothetical protein
VVFHKGTTNLRVPTPAVEQLFQKAKDLKPLLLDAHNCMAGQFPRRAQEELFGDQAEVVRWGTTKLIIEILFLFI